MPKVRFTKTVDTLMKQCSPLREALLHVNQLDSINTSLLALIPPPLNQHCSVANYRDNTLVIAAETQGWGTKIRFLLPSLIESLKDLPVLNQLQNVLIKVQPANYEYSELVRNPKVSDENIQLLYETAAEIQSENLRDALLRLAKSTQKLPENPSE